MTREKSEPSNNLFCCFQETVESLNEWLDGFPNVDDDIAPGVRIRLRMIRLVNLMETLREVRVNCLN